MGAFNVFIDDENRYFSEGLRLSIEKYAQEKNKTVCFLTQREMECADMVLVSSWRRAQRWRRIGPQRASQVVTVKERRIAVHETGRVLYRTDGQHKLYDILAEILSGDQPPAFTRRQALTQRERQIVRYLRCGFDQSQTARLLGVSVKTVHSHKRSIMRKLMLNRNHDFIYWLLSQEGEYS